MTPLECIASGSDTFEKLTVALGVSVWNAKRLITKMRREGLIYPVGKEARCVKWAAKMQRIPLRVGEFVIESDGSSLGCCWKMP